MKQSEKEIVEQILSIAKSCGVKIMDDNVLNWVDYHVDKIIMGKKLIVHTSVGGYQFDTLNECHNFFIGISVACWHKLKSKYNKGVEK